MISKYEKNEGIQALPFLTDDDDIILCSKKLKLLAMPCLIYFRLETFHHRILIKNEADEGSLSAGKGTCGKEPYHQKTKQDRHGH